MDSDYEVKRSGELLETELDSEILALHVQSGTCFSFNETASRVWTLLERPKRLSELQAVLEAEFEVDPNRCRQDLLELLDELRSDGLIEIAAIGTP